MRLFHFSDDPSIEVFEPRATAGQSDATALVWAIDEFHAPHYYFPRECPRVCFWPREDTTAADLDRFLGMSATRRVIAIEAGWYDRVRGGSICRYTFESEAFGLHDPNAGYYTTTEAVQPVCIDRIDDLMSAILLEGIELRITPSLMPLREQILRSTLNFSMIRMRNARA
jgi:hypothetical protein